MENRNVYLIMILFVGILIVGGMLPQAIGRNTNYLYTLQTTLQQQRLDYNDVIDFHTLVIDAETATRSINTDMYEGIKFKYISGTVVENNLYDFTFKVGEDLSITRTVRVNTEDHSQTGSKLLTFGTGTISSKHAYIYITGIIGSGDNIYPMVDFKIYQTDVTSLTHGSCTKDTDCSFGMNCYSEKCSSIICPGESLPFQHTCKCTLDYAKCQDRGFDRADLDNCICTNNDISYYCGNGVCGIGETYSNCPADCVNPNPDECSNDNDCYDDEYCDSGDCEELDCPTGKHPESHECVDDIEPVEECGNGICGTGETYSNCPADCVNPNPEDCVVDSDCPGILLAVEHGSQITECISGSCVLVITCDEDYHKDGQVCISDDIPQPTCEEGEVMHEGECMSEFEKIMKENFILIAGVLVFFILLVVILKTKGKKRR